MQPVQYIPRDKGSFILEENGTRIAEMVVDISEGQLSVYHTGVEEQAQGRGIGSHLVAGMADYARRNKLKVVPFCPFVKAVFKRHPDKYADLWEPERKN